MKTVSLFLISAALVGCASFTHPLAPENARIVAQNAANQNKALAAQQWGAIAADVAVRTKSTLTATDMLQGRTLYVASLSQSPFEQAFGNFMITSLVEAGLPVTMQQEASVEVRYETQVIQHRTEFDPRKVGYVPGAPENVGVNFWVMRNVDPKAPYSSPMNEAGQSSASSKAPLLPTSVEMLVTTSVVDGDTYLQRTTDVYYIEGADIELFKAKGMKSTAKEWEVVSQ